MTYTPINPGTPNWDVPLNGALVVMDANVTGNTNSIATLSSTTSALTAQVGTNTANIATNTTNIANNTSSISVLSGQVSTNTSNISSLTTQTNTNTANIATNTADIASNQTAMDSRMLAVEAAGPTPGEYGLAAWVYDPATAAQTSVLVSGSIHMGKIRITAPVTSTTVYLQVSTAGTTLTAGQNLIGLYDAAGNRVAITADQTASWGTLGFKTIPWVTPVALTPGYYYIAVLSNGATPITVARASAQSVGLLSPNSSAATLRWSNAGTGFTGQTTLPATVNMANRSSAGVIISLWTGIT